MTKHRPTTQATTRQRASDEGEAAQHHQAIDAPDDAAEAAAVMRSEPLSMKGQVPESWHCVDCGVNTAPDCPNRATVETAFNWLGQESVTYSVSDRTEVYHVRKHVWEQAGMGPFGGCLCVGCCSGRRGCSVATRCARAAACDAASRVSPRRSAWH